MSENTLHASTSRARGSRNSRRLREAGDIPAVVYGEGVSALPVSVNAKAFRQAVSGDQGLNSLITLEAGGNTYTVMAREIQRHPVRGTVAHVDFQVVDLNRAVVVEVPVRIVGDAVEVRHADWEVDQVMFNIEVEARPDQIPNFIEVDVSALTPGAAIRLGDLTLPEGVEAVGDASLSVVSTHTGRVAPAPEAAAVAVETVEAPAE